MEMWEEVAPGIPGRRKGGSQVGTTSVKQQVPPACGLAYLEPKAVLCLHSDKRPGWGEHERRRAHVGNQHLQTTWYGPGPGYALYKPNVI